MKSGGSGRELLELARLYRIQTSYLDMTKQPRKADPEALGLPSSARRGMPRKQWGIFAPIYSLHSKRNPSAGDLTDFQHLMDWMHELGGTVAATLPLLGAFLDEPFDPSPYSPATRLFWNEFY